MSQDKPEARTSHAHSVEPLKEGKLAEASKTVQQQFAKAAELRQAQQKQAGSEMVRQAGPRLNLAPNQAVREGADREACLLYTSDAAGERSRGDLGGRRII